MRRFELIAFFPLCLAVLVAPFSGGEPNPMDGRWEVSSLTIGGIVNRVEEMPNKPWFDMKDDAWTFWLTHFPGNHAVRFHVVIDKTKTPWEVDATVLAGASKGKVFQGICEMDGDEIRLCLADSPTMPRPAKFEAPPKTALQTMTMRRVAP